MSATFTASNVVRVHALDGLPARLPRLPCTIRMGKPDDLAFVVDSWTKHAFRGTRMRTATAHVRELLARDGSRLIVAHVVDDPDAILGWAATEDGRPACLHYVYVRSAARRQGVAAAMMGASVREATDYSSAPGANLEPPQAWTLNEARAKT